MNGVYGPPPSRLVFLSDLTRVGVGKKVRFLGCVESYDVSTATLVLKHAYPVKPSVIARVNIDHVLESMKSSELDIGAWLNIIGYIVPATEQSRKRGERENAADSVFVQAIMLWDAGDINLDSYEKAVEARKAADALFSPT